jgi:LysR family transcriptional regulator, nitrogen assimilation regulatory protein
VELRQLRYFKAIADARSFVRGADHMHVAQSALSRSIAKLEEQIGRALFVRHSDGVTLTDAGLRLYEHTDHLLRRVQRITDEMAADTQTPRGPVALGVPPSMQWTLTTPVAVRFIKAFPEAALHIVQDPSARLRDGVAAGLLDVVVIATLAPTGGLHFTPLFTESLCLIYMANSGFHPGGEATIEDLVGVPLILCGYPDTLRLYLNEAFANVGAKPTVRCEVNTASLVANLVAQGAGVGIAPYGAMPQHETNGLAIAPIRGLEAQWGLATSFERIGSTAVQELSKMIIDHVRTSISAHRWPTARFPEPSATNITPHE